MIGRFLTARDLAARYRISRSRAYLLMGEMGVLRIGRCVRVSPAAVRRFECQQLRNVDPATMRGFGDGWYPRAAPIVKLRSSLPPDLSELLPIRDVRPRRR
jgi:hypothetical protein